MYEEMKEAALSMEEVKETREIGEGSEAEALEAEAAVQGTEAGNGMEVQEAEVGNEAADEIPESITEVLQLTEAEKEAYQNIGKDVENMPVEGYIVGYKRGSCADRLIPIHDS